MTDAEETNESQADILCKSCGLCCTGHLFIWAKLRPAELDRAEALGMKVFRDDPTQRGFSQPCPLWKSQCTIHASPHYPHICRAYRCKLLKEVSGNNTSLPSALTAVEQAKGMIHELKTLLPSSTNANFRERLVAQVENLNRLKTSTDTDLEFRHKADALLIFYEEVFGVNDLVDKLDKE
jgi:hypothetical protein